MLLLITPEWRYTFVQSARDTNVFGTLIVMIKKERRRTRADQSFRIGKLDVQSMCACQTFFVPASRAPKTSLFEAKDNINNLPSFDLWSLSDRQL